MAEAASPIVEIKRRLQESSSCRTRRSTRCATPASRSRKGEFVCLIGASGCGKSTLLRIMAGFEQPSSGEALMWGKPIDGPEPARGMVFQDYALFPWLSVRDNIGFGPTARGLSGARGQGRRSTSSSSWSACRSSPTPIRTSSPAA